MNSCLGFQSFKYGMKKEGESHQTAPQGSVLSMSVRITMTNRSSPENKQGSRMKTREITEEFTAGGR